MEQFDSTKNTAPLYGDVYLFCDTGADEFGEIPSPSLENPYTLELTVPDNSYGDLSEQPVRIKVTLDREYNILLEATLLVKDESDASKWKESAYHMEAVLICDVIPKNVLVLKMYETRNDIYETEVPVTWTLGYIAKKGLVK